ncbi:MAG: hypothetical protein WD871_06585 [Xanthobacteraceae bacterium]
MACVRVVLIGFVSTFLYAFTAAAIAQQKPDATPAVIRLPVGLMFDVPSGWVWNELYDRGGDNLLIDYGATRPEKGPRENVNRLDISTSYVGASSPRTFTKFDINRTQPLPNGATLRSQMGVLWNVHYGYDATVSFKYKTLKVQALDGLTPKFDKKLVQDAALQIANSVREVPAANSYFHPILKIALEFPHPKRWTIRTSAINFGLGCLVCGDGSNTWIYVYPSSTKFIDLNAALASITKHFEKESIKIGEMRSEAIGEGQFAWTEQPGSARPFLGVIKRGDAYYFVQMWAGKAMTATNNDLRIDFLAAARSVRAWDGR